MTERECFRKVLDEDRHLLGDEPHRGFVPVVDVQMGDDHCIHVEDPVHWRLQRHERVAQVQNLGAGGAQTGPLVGEKGVDQETAVLLGQQKCGVAHLADLHGFLGMIVGRTTSCRRQEIRCRPWHSWTPSLEFHHLTVSGNADLVLNPVLLDEIAQLLAAQVHVVDRVHVNSDDGRIGNGLGRVQHVILAHDD